MKYLYSLFLVFLAVLSAAVLYFYTEIHFEANTLIDYKPQLTTQVYDRNGRLVANLFDKENRIYATFDEIPPRLIEALLAIEDTSFFEHSGINAEAIFRAAIKDIQVGKLAEGASTLTQQLVKNAILSREKTFARKFKEVLLAMKVDAELSKEEILERYLNEIYFGHGYHGIKTASLGYFQKELSELTLKECAILVGLPRAPSYYDPTKNYEESLERASRVLSRMHKLGWINDSEFARALKERPKVYDDTPTRNVIPYVVDEAFKQVYKEFPDIKNGGYRIDLTIDLSIQALAKEALKYGYDRIVARGEKEKEQLNGAIVVMENSTGEILALVGGIDYYKSQFNRATQTSRQPGSAIKPFIYQIALNMGYSGASQIPDIARTFVLDTNESEEGVEESKWQPKNYEGDYRGLISLRDALVHSRNLATINLVSDIGLSTVYSEMKGFGFENIPYDLSLALGSMGISPLKLSEAYSIISNYGVKVEPFLVKRVTDRFGKTKTFEPRSKKMFEPAQAYLLIDILKDVIKYGTGEMAKVEGIELAGKTGTTNKNIDAWFCGFSPTIQTIVWYGKDNNTPMRKGETGGVAAAPAFGYFYTRLLAMNPEIKRSFDRPEGIFEYKIGSRSELFTDISKPPLQDTQQRGEKLLF